MLYFIKKKIKKIIQRRVASHLEVEKAENIFYINYLKPGMTVFDVGANIGFISMLFAKFIGQNGIVHTFEPVSSTFNKLNTIISQTNFKNIILNRYAVTDKIDKIDINVYDETLSSWSSIANRTIIEKGHSILPIHKEEVDCITLDQYCEVNNINKIDLLKIDVEGAELQVVRGASRLFKEKKIQCCVFEYGETTFDMGNTDLELKFFFSEHGYVIRNIVKNDPIFPKNKQNSKALFSLHIAVPSHD